MARLLLTVSFTALYRDVMEEFDPVVLMAYIMWGSLYRLSYICTYTYDIICELKRNIPIHFIFSSPWRFFHIFIIIGVSYTEQKILQNLK